MPPSPAPSCTMFLIRHGATDYNLHSPPLLQGASVNLGLSSVGQSQAERTAAALRNEPLAAIYASPLQRAMETAAAIASFHSRLTLQTCPELVEVDVGRWESRSWIEIEQTEPEEFRAFQEDPSRFGYAGGENLTQVQERASPALLRLMERHAGETIAVIAHNVVNRAFLARLLNLPLKHARHLYQDNGCINVIRSRAEEIMARTINATHHLS